MWAMAIYKLFQRRHCFIKKLLCNLQLMLLIYSLSKNIITYFLIFGKNFRKFKNVVSIQNVIESFTKYKKFGGKHLFY